MHYHCEVIMPPSNNIQETLAEILAPFDENKCGDEDALGHDFWDWFVIGGRWAGSKEMCKHDPAKLEQFYKDLKEAKVTVSGFRCGKQEISPSSQIPMVDKMWNNMFPTDNGEVIPCPIFAHSNNQYDSNDFLSGDICRADQIPERLTSERVIIAGPSYDGSKMEANFMLCRDQWNGVNHMPIDWDGLVKSAVEKFVEKLKERSAEYAEKVTPKPDWICVTVDYHS